MTDRAYILCVGTTPTAQRTMIFDRVSIDAVNRALEVHEHASGKSVNVARVAHCLGERTLASGFLGGDRGEFIRRELNLAQIDHDFVTVAAQTRLCTTVVDRLTRTATELVEESSPVSAEDWGRLSETIGRATTLAKTAVFSGSLPPGGPADFYANCISMARSAGCKVVLDARGEPLRRALGIAGLIVKLNREEFGATLGAGLNDEDDLRQAIRQVTPPDGATIVTMGTGGAIAFDGRAFYQISAPKVKTISAIGSGDAFAAGLSVGITRGMPLPEACVLGAACGAANAETALSGHISPQRLPDLLAQVCVKDW